MTKFPVLPLAPSRNILIALSSGQGIQPWLMGLTKVASSGVARSTDIARPARPVRFVPMRDIACGLLGGDRKLKLGLHAVAQSRPA